MNDLPSRVRHLEERIRKAQVYLGHHAPFFSVLTLHARHTVLDAPLTARTDGMNVEYGLEFCERLSDRELRGVVLHEILHCALCHASRMNGRIQSVWNVACDIVVNGAVDEVGEWASLPNGVVRDAKLSHQRTEDVYEALLDHVGPNREVCVLRSDLVANVVRASTAGATSDPDRDDRVASSEETAIGIDNESIVQAETHWRQALAKAQAAQRQFERSIDAATSKVHGTLGTNLLRLLSERLEPIIDWRLALAEHLVKAPDDYDDFDRRFIHAGAYVDRLDVDTLTVYVCIDTSGSIDVKLLAIFVAELNGIIASNAHLRGAVFFADAKLDGPHDLARLGEWKPRGGGGTSFVPFFTWLDANVMPHEHAVAVYLTDGYGTFPADAPRGIDVMWVVSPTGLSRQRFPFGRVIRLPRVAKGTRAA